MPDRNNRIKRGLFAGSVVAVLVMLATLPFTAAWYTSLDWSVAEAMESASFEEQSIEPYLTQETVSVQQDPPLLMNSAKGSADTNEAEEIPDMEYSVKTFTLTAEGTASSGYFSVKYGDRIYYSRVVEPGESVSFTVLADDPYADQIQVEAHWGAPPRYRPTLDGLQDAFDKSLEKKKAAYLKEQLAILKEKKLEEEAAPQEGAAEEQASEAPPDAEPEEPAS